MEKEEEEINNDYGNEIRMESRKEYSTLTSGLHMHKHLHICIHVHTHRQIVFLTSIMILILLFSSNRKHVERKSFLGVKYYSECTWEGRRMSYLYHKVKYPHIRPVGAMPTPAH